MFMLVLLLFTLVINAGIILLSAKIAPGFGVDGFWWALLFSAIVFFINALFGVGGDGKSIANKD
jgi:putative membrane protein